VFQKKKKFKHYQLEERPNFVGNYLVFKFLDCLRAKTGVEAEDGTVEI